MHLFGHNCDHDYYFELLSLLKEVDPRGWQQPHITKLGWFEFGFDGLASAISQAE